MNIPTVQRQFQKFLLSTSSAALIATSGYKAIQFANTIWGASGTVLVVSGSVATFFALHTAFNPNATKGGRIAAAIAALALGLLEGGAILQGSIHAATLQATTKHEAALLKWEAEKTAIDNKYQADHLKWEADKDKTLTQANIDKQPLLEELRGVQEALTQNAASQRKTKASDKTGKPTPAYQALLDQQADLFKRSKEINAQLSLSPVAKQVEPTKPAYPVEPTLINPALSDVEIAQAFAFPALVVVLMFLRGRRDEENAALVEMKDIEKDVEKTISLLELARKETTNVIASIEASRKTALESTQQATAQLEVIALKLVTDTKNAVAATTNQQWAATEITETATETATGSKAGEDVFLSKEEVISLLKERKIKEDQFGLITTDYLMRITGKGRPTAEQIKTNAYEQGFLEREKQGKGWIYFYPRSEKLPSQSANNVVSLASVRGV